MPKSLIFKNFLIAAVATIILALLNKYLALTVAIIFLIYLNTKNHLRKEYDIPMLNQGDS